MDKLNALQIFANVAEQGSFSSAAKVLGGDPSTISKSIRKLESEIGVQLIQRSTRQLKITPAGESYLTHVRNMLDGLQACEESLKDNNNNPKGCLKINLPVSYGRLYVQPLIPEFCAKYPELDVELSYDDDHVDIIERGYDLAVRSGVLQDSRLVAQQLSSMDFITVAAPNFLNRHGINKFMNKDFAKVPWISFRFKQSGKLMPIMQKQKGETNNIDVYSKFVVDDGEAMVELCKAGVAVTQFPHFLAWRALQEQTLVPIYPAITVPQMGVYVIYPKREYLPARVRLFVDYLKNKMIERKEYPNGTWALNLEIQ